jgi:hypothetical protein
MEKIDLDTEKIKDEIKKKAISQYEIYAVLFHDLFFVFIQMSITLLLFVGILNLSKDQADVLYPVDLRSEFYGNDQCDLGNLRAGESNFCENKTSKIPFDEKAGRSIFASKLQRFAKNMGYVTADSFSIFLLWANYLAFSCEHFSQIMLNGMQSIAKSLYDIPFLIQFFIVVTLISLVNNVNVRIINPILTKLFKVFQLFHVEKNQHNIIIDLSVQLFVNVISITLLLFLFFIVPLTIYYIFALCKLLSENLSIQMNILSIFALFLTIKSLALFKSFMQSQFGASAILAETQGAKGNMEKAQKIINAGIQNKAKFNSFLSSYILFFIIPLVVSFAKLYKLILSLMSNMNPLGLHNKYKIIFISVILFSFYYPIKNDLDKVYKFPYSIIYAVISILTVVLLANKHRNTLK